MTKSELRKKYKMLRRALSPQDVEAKSIEIANRLLELDIWNYKVYHLFLPIEEHKEVNTTFIMSILMGKDKEVVLPRSNFDDMSMTHYLLTDSTIIRKNSFNIPEPLDGIEIKPEQIDVVFVPLLVFDEKGNRIGYGKGFYDRFLIQCRSNVLKIGLSFFDAEKQLIEVSKEDIKLDYCVTPNQLFEF